MPKLSADFDSLHLQTDRELLNSHLETLDYSKIIIPVNVGVKYRPPKLGIEFYLKQDENFNKSLNSHRNSYTSLIINDIDTYS